jgi:N-acetylglucosamine transport system permease protein
VYIAYSLPFTVFFLAAFFKSLPYEIEEAATVDGASHTRKFFQIMLPMARSGLVSITIFNIVGQWNQYLLPVVIMTGPGAESKYLLTQGIANISTSAGYQAQWSTLFAALTLSILPMIVVYAVFQRQIQAGLTAGAVK